MRKFNKEYWEKQTHGDWRFPYQYGKKKKAVVNSDITDNGWTLNMCTECDRVYEYKWMSGKSQYYKVWYYSALPKIQRKHKPCPKCKGKNVKIEEM